MFVWKSQDHTSFDLLAMFRQRIAISAAKISPLVNITNTASGTTAQLGIGHTASHAALLGAGSTGLAQSMMKLSHLVSKLANSATSKSHLINFTQTGALQMALRSTELGAKVACSKRQSSINQFCIKENLKEDRHRHLCSLPGSLTTQSSANKALGLTLILDTFLGFMNGNQAFALFQGSR
jgi:hypothetical protein